MQSECKAKAKSKKQQQNAKQKQKATAKRKAKAESKKQQANLALADVDEGACSLLDGPVQHDALAEGAQIVRPHVVRRVQRVEQSREPQAGVHGEELLAEVLRCLGVLQKKRTAAPGMGYGGCSYCEGAICGAGMET